MDYNKIFKQLIGEKYNYKCAYCGIKLIIAEKDDSKCKNHLTVDHKIPLSKNGQDELNNLVICCKRCNSQKKDKTVEEYRAYMAKEIKFTENQIDWLNNKFGWDLNKYFDSEIDKYIFPFEVENGNN